MPLGRRGLFGAVGREVKEEIKNAGTASARLHGGARKEVGGAKVGVLVTDLVPGVRSVCRIDEDGDDLGFGQESCSSLSGHLRVEVVGTLLEVVVRTGVGGQGEVLHVPDTQRTQTRRTSQAAFVDLDPFALVDRDACLCEPGMLRHAQQLVKKHLASEHNVNIWPAVAEISCQPEFCVALSTQ